MMLTSTVSPPLKLGLAMIGMWPGASCATFLWLFYMASLVAMQYFQYSCVYTHLSAHDFAKLMDGLSVTLDYTLTFFKLLSLWHNRRILCDIVSAMNDDWEDCVKDSYASVMTSNASLAHRYSNAMMTLNVFSTIFYFIGSHMSHRTVATAHDEPRDFAIQVQFPFDATDSPIFEFVVLGLFLHVLETATVIAITNSLLLTLVSKVKLEYLVDNAMERPEMVLHVSGQIDIMCQGLREFSQARKSRPSATRSLVERHQRIISLSNNIDSFFSFVALIQFVWNTVVICTIGFLIIISLATDMEGKIGILVQSIVPYIAVTLEAFVFCFAGEYLSNKSRSIGDAAYETLWYELPAGECRILLMIIVRSQKRLTITAGNVMDLTLECFTSVMKASASYISLLHAMY